MKSLNQFIFEKLKLANVVDFNILDVLKELSNIHEFELYNFNKDTSKRILDELTKFSQKCITSSSEIIIDVEYYANGNKKLADVTYNTEAKYPVKLKKTNMELKYKKDSKKSIVLDSKDFFDFENEDDYNYLAGDYFMSIEYDTKQIMYEDGMADIIIQIN